MTRNQLIFVFLGSMLAATAAFADDAAPGADLTNRDEREMECRFAGVFGDPKSGGSWEIRCKAEAEFELRDKDRSMSRDRLAVVCEASGERPEKIYDDGAKVRTLGSGRHVDLLVTGERRHDPKIFVNNVDLRDRFQERAAALEYQNNGFVYTLQGECRIKKENDKPAIEAFQ